MFNLLIELICKLKGGHRWHDYMCSHCGKIDLSGLLKHNEKEFQRQLETALKLFVAKIRSGEIKLPTQ